MDTLTFIAVAAQLGRNHARVAASWCIDGNTSQEHIARVLAMFDDGDPELYDYLPNGPNLSGEFADGLTPTGLYEHITGAHYQAAYDGAGLADETLFGSVMDAICDAYEEAAAETFQPECERIYRTALNN